MNSPDDPPEPFQIFSSKALEAGLELSTPFTDEPFAVLEWYYSDNGFRSRQAMERSHEPVVKLAAATLSQATGKVLDLGCGNGVLLKKICQPNGNLIPWGVDHSRIKIAHARLLSPRFADNFVFSDIFDDCVVWSDGRQFQLVILMLGRLAEVAEGQAEKLLRCIKERARNLLVYAYDDYLHHHGSLEELARKTGVTLSDKCSDENVAIVHLGKPTRPNILPIPPRRN